MQDLKEELECQTKAMSNGLVAVQGLSNGPDNEQPPTLDEREVEEVAILEKKLEDLKTKNDVSVVPLYFLKGWFRSLLFAVPCMLHPG